MFARTLILKPGETALGGHGFVLPWRPPMAPQGRNSKVSRAAGAKRRRT